MLKTTLTFIIGFCAYTMALAQGLPGVPDATAGYLTGSAESEGSKKQSSIPVNLSTGVPQISYPVAALSSKSASVNYSLTYDASGRKPDELATYNGWGWNLMGGGQIHRVVKGYQDEFDFANGCVTYNGLGVWNWSTTATSSPYVTSLPTYTGTVQLNQNLQEMLNYKQPDEFYFSFNGRSGMFVIGQDGKAQIIPFQNLKVEFQQCLHWFKITDESGYVYLYNSPSTTEFLEDAGVTGLKAATTWYLASITNPYGELEFQFTYENGPEVINKNQVNSRGYFSGSANCPQRQTSSTTYSNKSIPKRILEVTSNTGAKLQFKAINNRNDIAGDKSLDEVWIYNDQNEIISKTLMSYGYFKNENNGDERLKLNDIKIKNTLNEIETIASFVYDETISVRQDELKAGKDHWGYYNGIDLTDISDFYFGTSLKRVDPTKNQLGILKEITSGTGAKTTLQYETNTYSESPNGLVTSDPVLPSVTILSSVTVSTDQYYEYKDEHAPWSWAPPYGGLWGTGYLYPTPNCGTAYTFYNPSFSPTGVNPEVGANGQFSPTNTSDIDHPDNARNFDDLDQEIAYVPIGKTRVHERIFTVDNPQTISLTGTIAKSLCTQSGYISSIKIINANAPNNVVWSQSGNVSTVTNISTPVTISLGVGTYILVCTAAYPCFEDVAPNYVPRNFDSAARVTSAQFILTPYNEVLPSTGTKYTGGLRVASIKMDDGDSDHTNDVITKYEYNIPSTTTSSGYLFTNPIYSHVLNSFYKQYKMTGSGCSGGESLCHECHYERMSSTGILALTSANGAFLSYRNVREKKCTASNTCDQGWTDNVFSLETSVNPNPVLQEGNPYKYWKTGLPLESKTYKQDGTLITKTTNSYSQILGTPIQVKGKRAGMTELKSVAHRQAFCDTNSNSCGNQVNRYFASEYTYHGELYTAQSSISIAYDQVNPAKSITTTTTYEYNSAVAGMPSKIITETNDPVAKYTVQKIKYVGDYVVSANGNNMVTVLNYLKNTAKHSLNMPVETLVLQGNTLATLKVIGGSINTFRTEGGKVVADASYKLELSSPVNESAFTMSAVSGTNFSMNSNYRKIGSIISYDSEQRVISQRKENDILSTVIRDYTDGRVVAEITNAAVNQCAYTSFETSTGSGGWTYSNSYTGTSNVSILGFNLPKAKTGNRVFVGGTGRTISRSTAAGQYIVSFWATAGITLRVNGITQTAVISAEGTDLMDWKYYEYVVTLASTYTIQLTVGASASVDELRLYPFEAHMKTTAYNTDGTVKTTCGINNRCTTYLYDGWKRLEWTLDDNFQILTQSEYHNKNFTTGYPAYRMDRVITASGITKSQVLPTSGTDDDMTTSVTYLDGFGRELQSISVGTSPMQNHLVSFHVYDALGREPRKYLPYTTAVGAGFVANPITAQANFYNNATHVAHTTYPYSDTEFEASPLGRVLRQGNVGQEWQLNTTHTVAQKALLNDANEVLRWSVSGTYLSAMSGSNAVYYAANTLIKKETTDEHGDKMWEYMDTHGKLICKRAQNMMRGTADASYSGYSGDGSKNDINVTYLPGTAPTLRDLYTYYMYDDFGRLKYELPVAVIMDCNGNFLVSTTASQTNWALFDGYVTAYEYDNRSRQVRKKKPGEGWTEYVYNNLGQVILSKSPELSTIGSLWNYVKYDALGRPIQTGVHTNASTRATIQSSRDAAVSNLWETKTTTPATPYTNNSFPNTSVSVYTETYYDDYTFNNVGTFVYGTHPVTQSHRTRGAVTGTKTFVLGSTSTTFLKSINFYDANGRASVHYEQNNEGGYDKLNSEYDYTGKLTKTVRNHYYNSSTSTPLTLQYRYDYDRAGRAKNTFLKIGSADEVTISRLEYNEIGQVVKKHLHITSATDVGMQIIDYRYNERGWLTKINNADLVDDGDNVQSWDVFGEELVYHESNRFTSTLPNPNAFKAMEMKAQYNGNVAAVKWKTKGDPDQAGDQMAGHSYVFRYDNLGQMLGGYYAASTTTNISNYNTKQNHWDERVNYRSNGNISYIYRKRGKNDAGAVLTNAEVMDLLTFTYIPGSNKVQKIYDLVTTSWANRYSHFVDGTDVATEYTYDFEGRTTSDLNKGINYTYNHLDLVNTATMGSNTITFVWDATGRKLAKQMPGSNVIHYMGGIEYSNGVRTHIATPEGIARLSGSTWVYDYYLKDHLGNVRAVITNEESTIVEVPSATVEMVNRPAEVLAFENVDETASSKPALYPYDPNDPDNAMVSALSAASGKVMGPAKLLEVESGAKLDIDAQYWYTENAGDPLTDITDILAGTLLNLGTASSGIFPSGSEQGMALLNNVTSPQFASLHNFIEDAFEEIDLSNPQAYLVYIYFNKDSLNVMPQYSGVLQVEDPNALGKLEKLQMLPTESGFLYTYVTNHSESAVFFDKLTIKYWKPKVRVQYDYYPYGLPWENPSATGESALHDHLYQDKEFQFKDFADGNKGLMLYDFHARMYDPTTCMWMVPDPAAQFSNPYLAMANNPVIGVDPDGRFVPIIIGVAIGAYIGASMAAGNANGSGFDANPFDGSWRGTDWYKGAIVGGFIGAAAGMGAMAVAGTLPIASTSAAWVGASYKAVIGANIGILSNATTGGGLDGMYTGALIGAGAGLLSGFAAGTSFVSNTASFLGVESAQVTSGIFNVSYGMADATAKSIKNGNQGADIFLAAGLGALDGFISTAMFGDLGIDNPLISDIPGMISSSYRGFGTSAAELVIYAGASVVASPAKIFNKTPGVDLGNWWRGRASVSYERELTIDKALDAVLKTLFNLW